MSRTTKGSKGPGFECNTRRPGNKHGGVVGKFSKKLTQHRERQWRKKEAGQQFYSNS